MKARYVCACGVFLSSTASLEAFAANGRRDNGCFVGPPVGYIGCTTQFSSARTSRVALGVKIRKQKRVADEEMKKATQQLEKIDTRKAMKKERRKELLDSKTAVREAPQVMLNPFKSAITGNPFVDDSKRIKSRFRLSDVNRIEFIGSFAGNEEAWPNSLLPEVAFLGRSNVGKSSMLNTLFGEKAAKVSKTPGRTQNINLFKALSKEGKELCWFGDLPGYGYAKVGKDDQREIEAFVEKYLIHRRNLKLLVLLVDARREPLEVDKTVVDFVLKGKAAGKLPFKLIVAATKVDKLKPMESALNLKNIQEAFDLPSDMPIQFSSATGKGKSDIWACIKQACE